MRILRIFLDSRFFLRGHPDHDRDCPQGTPMACGVLNISERHLIDPPNEVREGNNRRALGEKTLAFFTPRSARFTRIKTCCFDSTDTARAGQISPLAVCQSIPKNPQNRPVLRFGFRKEATCFVGDFGSQNAFLALLNKRKVRVENPKSKILTGAYDLNLYYLITIHLAVVLKTFGFEGGSRSGVL